MTSFSGVYSDPSATSSMLLLAAAGALEFPEAGRGTAAEAIPGAWDALHPASSKLHAASVNIRKPIQNGMPYNIPTGRALRPAIKPVVSNNDRPLLLPGAFLVAMLTQLLAPFVAVDLGFATFFQ